MIAFLRGVIKFGLFLIVNLVIAPSQLVVLLFTRGPASYLLPQAWHKILGFGFGIRFEIEGVPNISAQTIYMANHISYLDIPLLGGLIRGSFVAKSEVARWPVFGFLGRLQRTVFIQRKSSKIRKQKHALQARLDQGQNLIIFPEGTSTDGREVLPFKSSLFSITLERNRDDLYVQPVTIALIEIDGHSVRTQDDRDLYSWHRDMDTDLATHLWRFAKAKGAKLRLTFHPPFKACEFESRKTLAKACHDNVSKGLETAITAMKHKEI